MPYSVDVSLPEHFLRLGTPTEETLISKALTPEIRLSAALSPRWALGKIVRDKRTLEY